MCDVALRPMIEGLAVGLAEDPSQFVSCCLQCLLFALTLVRQPSITQCVQYNIHLRLIFVALKE